MKQLTCPMNGLRDISEFSYGGAVKEMPPLDGAEAYWADYVFTEDNAAGPVFEWWLHIPSGTWFIAERDTRTDEVLRTMFASDFPGSLGAAP